MALPRQWNDTEKRPVFHLPCHGHRKINSEYLFNYIASGIRHWHSFNPVIHCIRRISLVFTDVNADDVHPINELTGINPRTMPDFVSTGRDYACRWVIFQCWRGLYSPPRIPRGVRGRSELSEDSPRTCRTLGLSSDGVCGLNSACPSTVRTPSEDSPSTSILLYNLNKKYSPGFEPDR